MHKDDSHHSLSDAPLPHISGYKVLHVIGNGSDATVYAAKCLKTGKKVALKVFDKSRQSKEGIQRTKQEIKLMSELDHPNIIKIYEAFDHQNKRFIVMENAGRGDLFETLYGSEANPSQTVMKESKARKLFVQVVSAIRHCHRRGIVHRDIKPENIFLDDKGNVKLGDFGLAMRYEPGVAVRQPVGSLLYASPEVLQHQPYVGPELDVWGLGILLYEMLCGTPPFSAESEQETCNKILRGDYAIPKFLSADAQQLISSMIKIAKLRATLDDITKHPWCRDEYARLETSYRSKRRDRESGDLVLKVARDPRKLQRDDASEQCFESGDCSMWSPAPSSRPKKRASDSSDDEEGDLEGSSPDSLDELEYHDSCSDEEYYDDDEDDREHEENSDAEGDSTDESGSDIMISPRFAETEERKPPKKEKKKGFIARGLSKALQNCRLDIPGHKKGRCEAADQKSPRSASSPALNY